MALLTELAKGESLDLMKTTVSTKGQIVLPTEIRRQDGIEPGEEFEVERIDRITRGEVGFDVGPVLETPADTVQ